MFGCLWSQGEASQAQARNKPSSPCFCPSPLRNPARRPWSRRRSSGCHYTHVQKRAAKARRGLKSARKQRQHSCPIWWDDEDCRSADATQTAGKEEARRAGNPPSFDLFRRVYEWENGLETTVVPSSFPSFLSSVAFRRWKLHDELGLRGNSETSELIGSFPVSFLSGRLRLSCLRSPAEEMSLLGHTITCRGNGGIPGGSGIPASSHR